MPTLDFKGKSLVYSHHLTVPSRTLETDAKKSLPLKGNKPSLDDNLIIHGDNLHALKALMPRYAGKIKCIYIDPPYNTGNEGWIYNDKVNSPMMQEWLKDKSPVDGEDLERHDKWLCMMWPRLHMLRELLAEDGVIFVSIDDNEQHHLRMMMDEIFGEENFIATVIWHKMDSPKNTALHFSEDHDYIALYARNAMQWRPNSLPRSQEMLERYKNPDNDPRGPWLLSDLAARNFYAEGRYSIETPSGKVIKGPPAGSYWRISKEKFQELSEDDRIWWGKAGNNRPGIKRFLSEVRAGVVPQTLWSWKEAGSTRNAKQELSGLSELGPSEDVFITPKPTKLLHRILQIATNRDSIILDSFAGSGTTAHAVLELNKEDGGNRKFILVECEDYADKITADRVRRVIKGVPKAKDETLARHLVYTATGQAPDKIRNTKDKDGFYYETSDRLFYLIYEPDLTFLRSADSALNSDRAERIAKQARKKKKTAVVFATHKFMGQKELTGMEITFCGLPYGMQSG